MSDVVSPRSKAINELNEGIKLLRHCPEYSDDAEVVHYAVTKNGKNLEYASARLQADVSIALDAVRQNADAIQYVIELTREVALLGVKSNGNILKLLNEEFVQDEEIVHLAVQTCGQALEVAREYQDNGMIVLVAVRNDGLALKYASKRLQDHRGIVYEAVKQNGNAVKFASSRLQKDKDIIGLSFSQGVFVENIMSDKDMMIEMFSEIAKQKEISDPNWFPSYFCQSKPKLILKILGQNDSLVLTKDKFESLLRGLFEARYYKNIEEDEFFLESLKYHGESFFIARDCYYQYMEDNSFKPIKKIQINEKIALALLDCRKIQDFVACMKKKAQYLSFTKCSCHKAECSKNDTVKLVSEFYENGEFLLKVIPQKKKALEVALNLNAVLYTFDQSFYFDQLGFSFPINYKIKYQIEYSYLLGNYEMLKKVIETDAQSLLKLRPPDNDDSCTSIYLSKDIGSVFFENIRAANTNQLLIILKEAINNQAFENIWIPVCVHSSYTKAINVANTMSLPLCNKLKRILKRMYANIREEIILLAIKHLPKSISKILPLDTPVEISKSKELYVNSMNLNSLFKTGSMNCWTCLFAWHDIRDELKRIRDELRRISNKADKDIRDEELKRYIEIRYKVILGIIAEACLNSRCLFWFLPADDVIVRTNDLIKLIFARTKADDLPEIFIQYTEHLCLLGKKYRSLILAAIEINPEVFYLLPLELTSDSTFVYEAIASNFNVYMIIKDDIKFETREFVEKIIIKWPNIVELGKIRIDGAAVPVNDILKLNPKCLEFLNLSKQELISAIKNCPLSLQYASKELQGTLDIVLLALWVDHSYEQYLVPQLKNDPIIKKTARISFDNRHKKRGIDFSLIEACKAQLDDLVEAMIENRFVDNYKLKDIDFGKNALMYAIEKGLRFPIPQRLIECGCNLLDVDKSGNNSFDYLLASLKNPVTDYSSSDFAETLADLVIRDFKFGIARRNTRDLLWWCIVDCGLNAVQSSNERHLYVKQVLELCESKQVSKYSLAMVMDRGRTAIDVTDEACRRTLMKALCFKEKYLILRGYPLHESSTSLVFRAENYDEKDPIKGTKEMVVVKLLKHMACYEREKLADRQGENIESVVTRLIDYFDDLVQSDYNLLLENLKGTNNDLIQEYKYGVILEGGDRSLDAIIRYEGLGSYGLTVGVFEVLDETFNCIQSLNMRAEMIHGDIKPLNVVRIVNGSRKPNFKLTDFDMACKYDDNVLVKIPQCTSYSGFLRLFSSLPPECFNCLVTGSDDHKAFDSYWGESLSPKISFVHGKRVYVLRSFLPEKGLEALPESCQPVKAHSTFDVWSYGVLAFSILTRQDLFFGAGLDCPGSDSFQNFLREHASMEDKKETVVKVQSKMVVEDYYFEFIAKLKSYVLKRVDSEAPKHVRAYLKFILCPDKTNRPSFAQILKKFSFQTMKTILDYQKFTVSFMWVVYTSSSKRTDISGDEEHAKVQGLLNNALFFDFLGQPYTTRETFQNLPIHANNIKLLHLCGHADPEKGFVFRDDFDSRVADLEWFVNTIIGHIKTGVELVFLNCCNQQKTVDQIKNKIVTSQAKLQFRIIYWKKDVDDELALEAASLFYDNLSSYTNSWNWRDISENNKRINAYSLVYERMMQGKYGEDIGIY